MRMFAESAAARRPVRPGDCRLRPSAPAPGEARGAQPHTVPAQCPEYLRVTAQSMYWNRAGEKHPGDP
jgi:hypothetical protein